MLTIWRYSVFFLSYSDHRYLHSFPTRRSSDLHPAGFSGVRQDGAGSPARHGASAVWPHGANRAAGSGADRKSTRLNSSHQIISYAVFCLKKKSKNVKVGRFTRYNLGEGPPAQ